MKATNWVSSSRQPAGGGGGREGVSGLRIEAWVGREVGDGPVGKGVG